MASNPVVKADRAKPAASASRTKVILVVVLFVAAAVVTIVSFWPAAKSDTPEPLAPNERPPTRALAPK